MEKFNLFQSYPSRDIQNRTSFFTIFMSILLLVAGVGLFFMPASKSESNLDALRIVVGCALIGFSLYYLSSRASYKAYVGTGSMICKKSLLFKKEHYSQLEKHLTSLCDLQPILTEEPQICLHMIYSKDGQYVAFQLLSYTSFLYEPVTDLYCLKGEKATTFIQTLHKSNGFLH